GEREAFAEAEGAFIDGRRSGVSVGPGEGEGAVTRFGESAVAGEGAGQGRIESGGGGDGRSGGGGEGDRQRGGEVVFHHVERAAGEVDRGGATGGLDALDFAERNVAGDAQHA